MPKFAISKRKRKITIFLFICRCSLSVTLKFEEGGLTLGLSEVQVNERVKKAKSIVPNAIGMNNHMGSAATADTTLMTYLMSALREQHLFF